jgi:hypothetical protein
MTFRTGRLIKNLHLPVQNEKIIYRQPVCFFLGDLKIPFKSPQSPKRERQGDWRRKRGWRGQTLTCVCAVPCISWTEQLRCREHFAGAPCNIRVLLRRHLQQHERTEGYWQRPHLPMALSYARQGKRVGANTLRALPSPRGMACALFILSDGGRRLAVTVTS